MHELTICQNAVELIEDQALRHGAKRVTAVWLEIGAFSCIEQSALTFCFELVSSGTLVEGCRLIIHQQEAISWCCHCKKNITLLSQKVIICPECYSKNLKIVASDDVIIKRLEVEEKSNV